MQATSRVLVALERLKEPFLEVPETRLSLADAASISGLDSHLCGFVLTALVDGRFLTCGPDGAYRRNSSLAEDTNAWA